MKNSTTIFPLSTFSHFSSTADNFRPYLTSFQGNAFTDYINAVFVDVSVAFISMKEVSVWINKKKTKFAINPFGRNNK